MIITTLQGLTGFTGNIQRSLISLLHILIPIGTAVSHIHGG
jgi:hypothetical protein